MTLYDISVPISSALPIWPGDPGLQIERTQLLERGDSANVSRVTLGTHTGTHMDAPWHFLPDGAPIDRVPLHVLIGPARVVAFDGGPAIDGAAIDGFTLRGCERVLFKTRNSTFWTRREFAADFVHLTPDGAERLVATGVRLVGMDYLSVDGFGVPRAPAHHVLLRAGVAILEGVDLSAVPPGEYELICLPLKIAGADGAPARAVLRTLA